MLSKGQFRVEYRGSTEDEPTGYDVTPESVSWDIEPGENTIVLRWKQDYTGKDAITEVIHNGTLRYESTLSNGIAYSGLQTMPGSIVTAGHYGTPKDDTDGYRCQANRALAGAIRAAKGRTQGR